MYPDPSHSILFNYYSICQTDVILNFDFALVGEFLRRKSLVKKIHLLLKPSETIMKMLQGFGEKYSLFAQKAEIHC